jgi:SAM-dependent methyltransferase
VIVENAEVARYWNGNAEAWTRLSRMGCDKYRDLVNSPAFFAMLPDVSGLAGLDIGCGEGHNTRMAAGRGAQMTGIDISEVFLHHANRFEREDPLEIRYRLADATSLPFEDESFDFAMATMSMMDMAHAEQAVREAWRVIRPGGFFQFSITHPCFFTKRWEWLFDETGRRVAMACGGYFESMDGDVDEWIFSAAPDELKTELPPFRVPRFSRTLSGWLNLLINVGFTLERFAEPCADEETARHHPIVADTRIIAYFLIIRGRKPAGL